MNRRTPSRRTPSRRTVLAALATTATVGCAGCLGSEPEADSDGSEYSCPDPFPVRAYNESGETRSIALTVSDGSDQVLFSETIELQAETGPYDGPELDVAIYDAERYTFDVASAGDDVSDTFDAKCGPVFVFITESGAVEIRDDELDHLREN